MNRLRKQSRLNPKRATLLTAYLIDIGIVIRNKQDVTIMERISGGCRDHVNKLFFDSFRYFRERKPNRMNTCTLDSNPHAKKKFYSFPVPHCISFTRRILRSYVIQIAHGTEKVMSQESTRATAGKMHRSSCD